MDSPGMIKEMASTSHSVATLEAVILDLYAANEKLDRDNTDLMEKMKILQDQNNVLRLAQTNISALLKQLKATDEVVSRFFQTIEDPNEIKREVIESILREHEKKMAIDSSSLPKTN